MKKITFFRWILPAAMFMVSIAAFAQGYETFNSISSSASKYETRNWLGDNGLQCSATDARTDKGINGKSITIRQTNGSITIPLTAEQKAAGVGVITFRAANKAATSDNTKNTTYKFECGTVVKTTTVDPMGTNTVIVTSPLINSADANEIKISITGLPGVRVTIDDVEWTASTTAATPIFSPAAGTYTAVQHVELTSATTGAKIYYTTNGDEPTNGSTPYATPIEVSGNTTIKAIAYDQNDEKPSEVVTAAYIIDLTPQITVIPTVTAPMTDVFVGDLASRTLTVSGLNLTGNLTASITGDTEHFSLSATSIETAGGTVTDASITITYAPTSAGAHTATVEIAGGGLSPFTHSIQGTAIYPPLAAPTATAVHDISPNGFTANWDAVTGATGYEVSVYTKDTEKTMNQPFTWKINGSGGNSGGWDGIVANGAVSSDDLPGWNYTLAYKGDNCVKIGSGNSQGSLTTPTLNFAGNAILTFRAGAWDGNSEQTELVVEISGGGTLNQTTVNMLKGAFTSYSIVIVDAVESTKLTFRGKQPSNSRFFLDDIVVVPLMPITGSPFEATGTSLPITGLGQGSLYFYTVAAKNAHVTSPPSNEIGPISLVTSGMTDVATIGTVWADGGRLMVDAIAGETIEVFSITGQKLAGRVAVTGQNSMDVTGKGIVIVKVGNRLAKVIL